VRADVDIHEYQAKELLSSFGVPVPRGGVVYSPEQASYQSMELGGTSWVVKAQVHSGGRGEAGGVIVCHSDHEVADAAAALFGRRLRTKQCPQGKLVSRVYVEEMSAIERELYFAVVLDRTTESVLIVASADGGVEIEELAARAPEAVIRTVVDPASGFLDFQAREIACALGLDPALIAPATRVFRAAYRAFRDLDASLVEINPLVVTGNDTIVALDARMSFDDNATYRHPEIAELRDRTQEDLREAHAADRGLAYVGLDGTIGCIINGAGLAMATMDMIKLAGGTPANFLDIGGGASPDRVRKAFRAVLQDRSVTAVLVNIFAGINRCDWVAQGIVSAFEELEIAVPVVVRLSGTNVEQGRAVLEASNLPIQSADTLAEAARKVTEAATGAVSSGNGRPATVLASGRSKEAL
jgi:malate-CoA ligase subunit beta